MLGARNFGGVGADRILYPDAGGKTKSQVSSSTARDAGSGRYLGFLSSQGASPTSSE